MSTATAPAITCPDWCFIDMKQHKEDLYQWEGHVLHRGRTYSTADRYVEVFAYAWPDGTLDMEEPPSMHVLAHPDDAITAEDEHETPEMLARSITKAAEWLRDITTRQHV